MLKRFKDISIRLLLGAFAMLLFACDHKNPEVVDESPIRSSRDLNAVEGVSVSPNSAFLEWDPVFYPNLRGYRVYFGLDPDMYLQLPGQGIEVGKVTSYRITGLTSGRRYYFAVTSVDYSDNESDFSEQVYKDIP